MTLAEARKDLAFWERRETARKRLHTHAQQDLLEAREDDEHPRQHLVDRRDKRSDQLAEARKKVAELERKIEQLEDRKTVRRPYERRKRSVRNKSSRGGAKIVRIVLHSTESHNRAGLSDVDSILSWFDNPGSDASSSVIVDDEAISAQCVPDSYKPWTQAFYNPGSLSIEMIGFAAQGKKDWTDEQVEKVAKYIAYWSKKYDIPIKVSTSHGVCTHKMLGAAGGGHVDPGPNFPLERALDRARTLARTGW
jgi:N-acetyl-anhydromuramyl-L-alanine amidase AmpD